MDENLSVVHFACGILTCVCKHRTVTGTSGTISASSVFLEAERDERQLMSPTPEKDVWYDDNLQKDFKFTGLENRMFA